jgi:hypothetical protein
MLENISEEIIDFIENEGRDIKFKIGDDILPIIDNSAPYISYDYLLVDDSEYSFHSIEFQRINSEIYPHKTDYQIYFDKVKSLCCSNLNSALNDTDNFKMVGTSKNINAILLDKLNIDISKLHSSQIPQFGEIRLYTNKNKDGAPRVFFFIGSLNIIYILFYDKGHTIFNASTKQTAK